MVVIGTKSTPTLDPATVQALEAMVRSWGVSTSKVLLRVIWFRMRGLLPLPLSPVVSG
jgi:hypothetical protein